jgi:hypothetical protein
MEDDDIDELEPIGDEFVDDIDENSVKSVNRMLTERRRKIEERLEWRRLKNDFYFDVDSLYG